MNHATLGRLRLGIIGAAVWLAPAARGEEITVSTYYPSPRGVYDELRANTVVLKDKPRGSRRCTHTGISTPWRRTRTTAPVNVRPANGEWRPFETNRCGSTVHCLVGSMSVMSASAPTLSVPAGIPAIFAGANPSARASTI